MKPVTLYVSDEVYSSYQSAAARKKTKTAVLIRNAMNYYLKEKISKEKSFADWQPLDLGGVKKDWIDGSYRTEMIDDRY